MAEVKDFYNGLPFFTRQLLSLTLLTTILTKLWWDDYKYFLVLDFNLFFNQFQLWRPITALFYYPIYVSTWFHFVTNCWVMYCWSETLENTEFRGRPADFLTVLLFNWICCVGIGFAIGVKYLMDAMAMSVLQLWCLQNNTKAIVFRIGWEFKAKTFPWLLLVFSIIINRSGVMDFIGILVGHLSYFVAFKYPDELGGPALLRAPRILKKWFPETTEKEEWRVPDGMAN